VAAAAYRAAERLIDEVTGLVVAWQAIVPAAVGLVAIGAGLAIGCFRPGWAQCAWFGALIIWPVIRHFHQRRNSD
jgi:hypothetical protein